MNENFKKRNVTIITISILILLIGISTIFYINSRKNKTFEVEATVKLIGDDYIVVENDNVEKYSLQTEEEYQIGDRVDFVIKNIKNNTNPKEGAIVKIDAISKNINFYITDNYNSTIDTPLTNEKKEDIKQTLQTENEDTESDVIAYFETLNSKIDTYNQDKSIGESLKSGFITVVDFLFYEGKIKGKTFNELSTTAKIKVLKLAFSIDEKIEKYFPGYKETISEKGNKAYTTVKTKALELYLDTTTKICKDNLDTCEAAKEGLRDLKTSFSLTWDLIKDIAGTSISKLKDWYEIWKEA